MHKIERLLQTLAPKGVEFRKLGDIILSLKTGLNPRKFFKLNTPNANNYYVTVRELEEHTIKFTHQTDRIDDNALSLCLKRSNLEKDDILFSGTGTIGKVSIIKENPNNWAIKEGIYSIKPNKKIVFPKFLMFCFENLNIQNDIKSKSFGGIVKSISMNDLQQIEVPIPPLEIQQEIVKILDAFTELNTELNARKKQYEYYQNMLLDFNDINQNHKDAKMSAKPYPKRLKTLLQTLAPKGVEFRKLGEVCEIIRGKRVTKKEILDKGKYPVVSGGIGFMGYLNEYNREENTITIAQYGTAGFVNWQNQKFWANDVCFSVIPKETLINRYLYYVLTNMQNYLYSISNRSAIPYSISSNNIMQITIPIPPLEIQQEIVKILDQFSLLTTDLLAGIPAEIKARKKQYEYYREKLLTFKPLQNKE
ncbi:restriction endonuclease subunit S [Helicobacter pylori]|uniref:restriction endonuclease subunit S n=1 Tax=Helicobacter pylori TaxID=210 RepID=UPI00165C30B1|nr:restriction endonuclease subunit S [Helicobacter pylori]